METESKLKSDILNQKRILIILLFLSIILYINILGNEFVWDDHKILRNPFTKSFDLTKIFSTDFWYPSKSGSYRPISILSYSLNYFLSGRKANSTIYHSFNLLIYVLDVFLVFFVVKELTKNMELSFIISLIFLAHPIHTENVATLFGRPNLIYFLFIFSSFLLHIKNYSFKGLRANQGYIISLILFFLGTLSKETAITLLGFIGWYDLSFKYKYNSFKEFFKEFKKEFKSVYIGYIFIAFLWIALRIYLGIGSIHEAAGFLDNPLISARFIERVYTGLKLIGLYIFKLSLPLKLSADYSYAQISVENSFYNISSLLSTTLIVLLLGYLILSFKENKTVFFSLGFLLISLIPICNILLPIGSIFAERFLLVPSFAFSILLGKGIWHLTQFKQKYFKKLLYVILVLLITTYSVKTIIRNNVWKNELNLWEKTVKTSPLSAKSHANLGMVYLKNNESSKAIIELNKALKIYPKYPQAISNLGVAYGKIGKYKKAINILQEGSKVFPKNKDIKANLAIAFYFLGEENMKKGLYKEARDNFKKALQYNPNLQEVRNLLHRTTKKLEEEKSENR